MSKISTLSLTMRSMGKRNKQRKKDTLREECHSFQTWYLGKIYLGKKKAIFIKAIILDYHQPLL